MGSGSSGTKTEYTQSPEQRQMYRMLMPLLGRMIGQAQEGQGLWQAPEMPQYGAMPTFNLPQYGAMPKVPGAVLPTSGWMSGIAPEVMAGVKEPYMEGQKQLMETLGAQGQLGSAAGFSGQGAAGLGEYWAKASPQIGLQAWNMVAPEQMRYGQQQYEQGMLGRGQEYQRQLLEAQTGYQAAMLGREQEYTRQLQGRQDTLGALQAPYQMIPAMMGGMAPTFSQGITSPSGNYAGTGMGLGALAGAGLAYGLGGPVGTLPLYMLGGGMFGGSMGSQFGK